jgi:hypothetical protein
VRGRKGVWPDIVCCVPNVGVCMRWLMHQVAMRPSRIHHNAQHIGRSASHRDACLKDVQIACLEFCDNCVDIWFAVRGGGILHLSKHRRSIHNAKLFGIALWSNRRSDVWPCAHHTSPRPAVTRRCTRAAPPARPACAWLLSCTVWP